MICWQGYQSWAAIDINQKNFEGKPLGQHIYWYIGDQPFEIISQPQFQGKFTQGKNKILNFGYEISPVWYRLNLFNSSQQNRTVFFQVPTNHDNELKIYLNNQHLLT